MRQERFTAEVKAVTVEQRGPVRAVVRVEGRHRADRGRREWLPFTVRLYFYAGSDGIRMVHTFVFDGDEAKDFISGLGVRFQVPMTDQPHDRHVRFAGDGDGVLGEAVRGITGLRRDPGAAVRQAQIAGRPTPDVSTWDTRVSGRLHLIPAWGDYSLRQLSDGGFDIRKRTTRRARLDPGRHRPPRRRARLRRRDLRRARVRHEGLLAAAPDPARRPRRGRGHRRGHRLAVVARRHPDGPALLPRRHGPGHLPGAARRAGDHVRGLRAGLRQPVRDRPHHRAVLLGAGRHAVGRAVRPAGRGGPDAAAARRPAGPPARRRRLRRLGSGRPRHPGPSGDRGPAGLPRRLPPRAGRPALLVRVLELRRRHAQLRHRPARVAVRRRRVRLGQLRALSRPVAVVPVPALRPGRRVPVRRGDDPAHRRGRRLPPRQVPRPRHPPRRAALGGQRQAAAHQHRRVPPVLLLPHRRRAGRRPDARPRRRRPHLPRPRPDPQDPHRAVRAGPACAGRRLRHRLERPGRGLAHRVGTRRQPDRPAAPAVHDAHDRRSTQRVHSG